MDYDAIARAILVGTPGSDIELINTYRMMARAWNAFEGEPALMEQALNELTRAMKVRGLDTKAALKNI